MVLPGAGRCRTSILWRTFWLPLLTSLLMWRLFCEACNNITFNVPHKLKAGVFIGKVNMKRCSNHSGIISSNNPNFTVLEDGSLYTTNALFLSSHGNTITLSFSAINEKEPKKIHVNLLTNPKKARKDTARHARETVRSRSKRRWLPVPTIIMENSLGPFPMQIQQLSSDMALKYNIRYSISGPGVDKPPLNYFYIEADTGNLFVTCPIDREEYPEFQLICYAMTSDGYTPEVPLVHTIKIEDDNDNAPVFEHDVYIFHIPENSKIGTVVGQVTATDNDEPHTLHTKVKYKIVNRNLQIYQNSHIFVIHPDTGCITVASSHLDRETTAEYELEIEARDMGGQDFGLCSKAIVLIEVGDVNDNAPQLGQTVYEVSVSENTEHLEILCIPVIDNDEPGTPSWLATFTIIKGNEDNNFYITVDENTNVGCLILSKKLDYENTKERRLEIIVDNEATYVLPLNARAVSTSLITVVISVRDEDEGPVFEPCEYILNIKECLPSGTVVGNYEARDPETGSNRGLSYRIIKDECNWITIDDTGDLRTTTILDRDVPDMEYSECSVTVSATDQSGKTGTGKIVIKLMDENDNYPIITRKDYIMCKDKKPICITAFDADLPPNTAPFNFEIETPVSSTWTLTPKKDDSALISLMEDIDYGYYTITIRIYDNGGNNGISEITIHYCDCIIPSDCSDNIAVDRDPLDTPADRSPYSLLTTSAFFPWGALGLGSVLMMGGMGVPFGLWLRKRKSMTREVSDNMGSPNFSPSNTEAPGEELMDLNVCPVETMKASMSMSTVGEKIVKGESLEMVKGGKISTTELVKGVGNHVTGSLRDLGQHFRNSCKDICSEWQHFTNPHLAEKVFLCEQDDERKHLEEYVLSYNYEGKGSPVGSLSSCTGESEEEELDFLNQPEPPFRILVEAFVKDKHAYTVPENCNSLERLPVQSALKCSCSSSREDLGRKAFL
uniref:Desmocollin-1-like n=1 Tax=Pogona vitticeps TaxID=103695 RepID=A0ABM5GDD1_9SAUR